MRGASGGRGWLRHWIAYQWEGGFASELHDSGLANWAIRKQVSPLVAWARSRVWPKAAMLWALPAWRAAGRDDADVPNYSRGGRGDGVPPGGKARAGAHAGNQLQGVRHGHQGESVSGGTGAPGACLLPAMKMAALHATGHAWQGAVHVPSLPFCLPSPPLAASKRKGTCHHSISLTSRVQQVAWPRTCKLSRLGVASPFSVMLHVQYCHYCLLAKQSTRLSPRVHLG